MIPSASLFIDPPYFEFDDGFLIELEGFLCSHNVHVPLMSASILKIV